MALTTFPGGGADIEEPEWSFLIPNKGRGKAGDNQNWRDYAHREWVRTTAALRDAELLSSENRHQVQRLVIAYVRYDRAAAMVFAQGAVTEAVRTRVPQLNLWQVEMRAADTDATTAEMELGIPPRRRGSVTKSRRLAKKVAPSDAYLAGKKA